MNNPYEILGVDKNATQEEIKKKYRALCKEHHPDKNGDQEKFKEIGAAYEILSDEQKRKNYDMFGDPNGQPNHFGGGFGGFDMRDAFSDFFGGGRQQRQEMRGSDINITLNVTLHEILFGADKKIAYNRNIHCVDCSGKGGTNTKTCTKCKGQGRIAKAVRTQMGIMQQIHECDACEGTGSVVENVCKTCHGSGCTKHKETIDIKIPAGVHNEVTLPVYNQGNFVKNGTAGHLIVKFNEIKDEFFTRSKNNLHHTIKISITEAVLGCKKTINSPLGELKLNIDNGCESGKTYSFNGKGTPILRENGSISGHGNLIVQVDVVIPKKISKEEKELFEQLETLSKATV